MSETWNLSGPFWRIPVTVEWHDAVAAVTIVPLNYLGAQKEAAEQFLNRLGRRDECWWIERRVLEQYAEPCRHTDLEMAVRWNPPEKIVASKKGSTDAINEFVADVCQQGIKLDHDVVSLIYSLFCRVAQDWLLNKQKPVDLYFCRLHPMPLRENWQQMALHRAAEREQRTEKKGKPADEINLEFISYHTKHKIVIWSIAVEPRPAWYEMVIRLELAKRKLGAHEYVLQTKRSLQRCYPSAEAILQTWYWQTAFPPVYVHVCERESHLRFKSGLDTALERLHKHRAKKPKRAPRFDGRFWKVDSTGRTPKLVRRETPARYTKKSEYWKDVAAKRRLPKVPVVRRKVDDLRKVGPDLSGCRDGTNETTGLPVLPAVQESTGRELLAGREAGESPMEPRTEQPS